MIVALLNKQNNFWYIYTIITFTHLFIESKHELSMCIDVMIIGKSLLDQSHKSGSRYDSEK